MMEWILVVSLYTSLLTIGFAMLVVVEWCPRNFIKWVSRGFDQYDLLVLGILIGFVAVMGDNLYWLAAWYSKLRNREEFDWYLENGPTANIFFRHILKITAAACHLEAARRSNIVRSDDLMMKTSIVFAFSSVLFYMMMR